ncbi:MAG: ABC transporter permease [Actinobacteria bacterium]|nr:ABC transporter permease [Actinomycetota bacterium]
MSNVLTIGWFETKRYLGDKVALFTTVVMPVLLVVLIGLSFGSTPDRLSIGVLTEDPGPAASEFTQQLESANLDVIDYTSQDDLARDIRLGFITAGLTVPAGFSAAADSPDGQATVTMSIDQTSANGGAIASAIQSAAAQFAEQRNAVRVATNALGTSDPAVADAANTSAQQVIASTGETTVDETTLGALNESDRNGFASAVPTQLTLFVFLNGLLAGMTLVESRRLGVSKRMLATPTGIGPHILGIGLGRWWLGGIQAALLLAIGALLFGVDFGNWGAVAVLAVVWTALAAAVGMLIGSLARTADQVVAISVPLGIGMGMLGGSMWPLSVVPPFMRAIAHATPHAWANDAWIAIIDGGAGVGGIATELLVLSAVTVAMASLAVFFLRRTLSK